MLASFQGRGYGGEMVGALVDWAFEQSDVHRVVAETAEDNVASLRLLERLGFSRDATATEPEHIRFVLDRRRRSIVGRS